MTELLYFSSDALSTLAMVQSCQEMGAGYVVTLDRTIFHPQGGGQPSDAGHMGDALVDKVTSKSGEVLHSVDRSLPLGPIVLHVDEALRTLHSRLHSAGHLIGNAVTTLGLFASRAHHWPGESRVLVSHPTAGQALDLEVVQALVDDYVAQDLPRHIHQSNGHREIGFGELASFACGGTHVKSTGVIGRCIVGSVSDGNDGIWIRYTVA